jgi:hypothetical protein
MTWKKSNRFDKKIEHFLRKKSPKFTLLDENRFSVKSQRSRGLEITLKEPPDEKQLTLAAAR